MQVIPVDAAGRRGHAAFAEFGYERYADVWLQTHFNEAERANPEVSGDSADPDEDGLSNAWERFFALNPRDPADAAKAAPRIASREGNLTLGFRVPAGGTVGADGVYRTSDLAFTPHEGLLPTADHPLPPSWIAAWSLQPLDGGAGWLEFDLQAPPAARRFFRLEASD